MTDAAPTARVTETDIFVRISPDQKMRIVRALRRNGYTVGFWATESMMRQLSMSLMSASPLMAART